MQIAYSDGFACTNGAVTFFSRLRRAERGHHHHISGVYLARYAQESAFRESHRRMDNGSQVKGVVGLALASKCEFRGHVARDSEMVAQDSGLKSPSVPI